MSKFLNQYYLCILLLAVIYVMGKCHIRLTSENTDLKEEVKTLKSTAQKNDALTSELFISERGIHERTEEIMCGVPEFYDYRYSDDFMRLYRAGLGYE